MGIQDRHDDRDHSQRKPRGGGPSTARLALFWIAVGALLFAVFRLAPTLDRRSTSVAPATVPSPPARAVSPSSGVTPSAPRVPFESHATPPSPPSIYRCGNQYGREPCAGARVVDQPAASGFDSRPSERLARLVADGRSANDEGVTTVTRTVTTGSTVDAMRADRSAVCMAWADEIAAIDRRARQPQSVAQQDWLRERRKHARDQQAAMRC